MSPSANVPIPAAKHDEQPFAGFEQPTANFIYCPNQFFDLCLPHSPQVVVRLVAYILDKTLGAYGVPPLSIWVTWPKPSYKYASDESLLLAESKAPIGLS